MTHKLTPTGVEFHEPSGCGVRVVRVFLNTTNPRIVASVETPQGTLPMSLFLDEILDYIDNAKEIFTGTSHTKDPTLHP